MDGDSGKIIEANNADVPNHPASLTKMMTLYLLFDALESGRVHLRDGMPVSVHAARQAPSKLGLSPGQTISVEDAILGLVTKSANDAAVVIAEYLGGTEPEFAAAMTRKARELGMTRTVFRNASGLPIAGQWSTPRDMAVLARALIRSHSREYHYFSTREFDYAGQVIPTHNHLLGNYAGADGIKTGYIASSGFNLVASAKRDGHRIIGVVFGGNTVRDRDRQMVALLDAGFAHIQGAPAPAVVALQGKADEDDAADNAPAPANEEEAEDPQVAAVMQSLASAASAAQSAPRPVEGAGDADEAPWGIRLGAYGQRARAEQVVSVTFQRLGDLVAEGHSQVSATRQRHSVLYRAELVGLAESDAQRACKALRHHRAPCSVIRTESEASR
jgi:D-alanyl-D-alanine carboxypeptidase